MLSPSCASSRCRPRRLDARLGPTFVIAAAGVGAASTGASTPGAADGGLYFPWDPTSVSAPKVLEIEGAERYRAPLVLEGGSIHVDGEGTADRTEECLLNRNRNPELSREQIEQDLRDYLGAEKMIWLAAASSTTRPTGTSTTSPASCGPVSCC